MATYCAAAARVGRAVGDHSDVGLTAAHASHQRFLDWCKENGITLHEHLRLQVSSGVPASPPGDEVTTSWADLVHHGMAIYVQEDEAVKMSDGGPLAASIPKTAILSPQSSSLSSYDRTFVPCSIGGSRLSDDSVPSLATPQLALCLMHEFILGEASRFWPYLATLPPHGVDLPRMWTEHSPEFVLLRDTEAGHLLSKMRAEVTETSPDHCVTDKYLKRYFFTKGLQHLQNAHPGLVATTPEQQAAISTSSGSALTLNRLRWWDQRKGYTPEELFRIYDMAASLVSTRSFVIDLFHVLAMVPLADAFNHYPSPCVQFECDDVVCTECGALYECEHDDPADDEDTAAARSSDAVEVDTVNLRFTRDCSIGAEVYNSYGDLSHFELLIRYGFVTNVLEMTCYSWPLFDPDTGQGIEVAQAFGDSAERFPEVVRLAESVLAIAGEDDPSFNPSFIDRTPWSRSLDHITVDLRDDTAARPLFIREDGSPNARLWITAFISALLDVNGAAGDAEEILGNNALWWTARREEKGRHVEEVCMQALAKIGRLVETRLAKLRRTFNDEHLRLIEHGDKYTFAVRGAARCNSAERHAMRSYLRGLDEFKHRRA
ncbi:hypothetical protein V8E36_007906 [Tilletia maclaganii]